jgi:hypothetical protein
VVVIAPSQKMFLSPESTGNGSQGLKMVDIPSAMFQLAKYLI